MSDISECRKPMVVSFTVQNLDTQGKVHMNVKQNMHFNTFELPISNKLYLAKKMLKSNTEADYEPVDNRVVSIRMLFLVMVCLFNTGLLFY